MRKQEVDYILAHMLDSHEDISDLNITVGRPLQVESSGELMAVDLDFSSSRDYPFSGGDIRAKSYKQGSHTYADPG